MLVALGIGSGSAALAADGDFHPGGAKATTSTIGMEIVAGNATIGYTLGVNTATYRDQSAVAQASAIDLGALPVLLGDVSRCDAAPAILERQSLPPQTLADTAVAGSAASRRVDVFFPGLNGMPSDIPAGAQDATASSAPQPTSQARTDLRTQDVGLFAIYNPTATAETSLSGTTRRAHAVVAAESLTILGGAVRFYKPRWEATATSGGQTSTTGTFTFEQAYLFEIPRTPEQISADMVNLDGFINSLLSGLGAHFDMPQVVVSGRKVTVTPMRFRLTDPPLGPYAIRPFMDQIRPFFEQWSKDLIAADCNNARALQFLDVLLQVLKGAGSVQIPVGGVEVETDDLWSPPLTIADNSMTPGAAPAQAVAPTTPPPDAPDRPYVTTPSNEPTGTNPGSTSYRSNTGPSDTAVVLSETTIPPVHDPDPLPTHDAAYPVPLADPSALSRYQKGRTGGTAAVVAVLALIGAAALAVGDRMKMRGMQRRIP